ncbi:MAG: ATP-dependent zinc metalloprotease FtsH [bacterium]|nr:ATP-dependent zinc metalloprotease FtsH [bacterium]
MNTSEALLVALRQAVQQAPENVALRMHLADTLLDNDRPQEAEKEYRAALALAPDDLMLKIGLACAFYEQGKLSESLVIIEDILKDEKAPVRAHMLHARLLLAAGEKDEAARAYRRAIAADPSLADDQLAERLRPYLNPQGEAPDHHRERLPAGELPEVPDTAVERPQLSFKDVGGMEKLKDEIRMKIIFPLTRPELYQAYGKKAGGGILLYGPPGCGKTYLARATAGEVKAGFLAVGINEVLDMWLGQSEANLHEMFEQARRNTPCVLFFDEVDALGASRSDMRRSAGRQLINQFLAELDGVNANNEGVLILAATNAPWHLDSAFRRPGRFDRILFVPPPDAGARTAILKILLQGKPAQEIDFALLAKKTEDFSGADLKAGVEVAIEDRLREAMKTGTPAPLTTKSLLAAIATLKPTTKEWFATARNYALYSNQGGIYDEILAYLKL